MRRPPFLLLLLALCLPAGPARALQVVSVTPSRATPGDRIVVTGGPFSAGAKILLGTGTITPEESGQQRLVFTLPELPAGDYALSVRDRGETAAPPLAITILAPAPRIRTLNPANLDLCSSREERKVVVVGDHFHQGANLLLDHAAVPLASLDVHHITFFAPHLEGGMHDVQVVNPDGQKSIPFSLYVNAIPEILDVHQGSNDVVSYQVIIDGKNFLYSSSLVVNGTQINNTPLSSLRPLQSDHVEYVNCHQLIYYRYPYSWELKRVSLQVVNPGGLQSPVYYVNIP